MQARSNPFVLFRKSDNLAFIVVVVASFVMAFVTGSYPSEPLALSLFMLLGLVYLLIGIYGSDACERSGSGWCAAGFFVVEIALGVIITTWSVGSAWLLMLPLVGVAIVLLPRWGTLLVMAVLMAAMMGIGYLIYGRWDVLATSGVAFFSAMVFVAAFTYITVNEQRARAEVERLASELDGANRQLRDYAVKVEELATAQERNRLAREIHDGLGHYLTAINMQLRAAQAVWEQDSPRALDAMSKAQGLTEEALADVRRSVAALRSSPVSDRPLPEAIKALVDEICAAGLEGDFRLTGEPRRLPAQIDLTLYRVAQEGLTNICKHAQASHARLSLEYRPGSVHLAVWDDGIGAQETPGGGFGLFGLRERVSAAGGVFEIKSAPNEGFCLEVELPA